MIQFNPSTGETKIVESKHEAFQRISGKRNLQHGLNDLLWALLKDKMGGSITVSAESLRRVPFNAKFVADFNGKDLTIIATEEKGKVLVQPTARGIIEL